MTAPCHGWIWQCKCYGWIEKAVIFTWQGRSLLGGQIELDFGCGREVWALPLNRLFVLPPPSTDVRMSSNDLLGFKMKEEGKAFPPSILAPVIYLNTSSMSAWQAKCKWGTLGLHCLSSAVHWCNSLSSDSMFLPFSLMVFQSKSSLLMEKLLPTKCLNVVGETFPFLQKKKKKKWFWGKHLNLMQAKRPCFNWKFVSLVESVIHIIHMCSPQLFIQICPITQFVCFHAWTQVIFKESQDN